MMGEEDLAITYYIVSSNGSSIKEQRIFAFSDQHFLILDVCTASGVQKPESPLRDLQSFKAPRNGRVGSYATPQ